MAFNINHSLRRTSHEMQTLSNVEKLMEIMEEKNERVQYRFSGIIFYYV